MSSEPTLDELRAEQEALQLSRFDYEFAWDLGKRIREEAKRRELLVGIAVKQGLDDVFVSLLPGATADNLEWMRRKAATVKRFQRSSLYMRIWAQEQNVDFNARFHVPASDYVASGGGVPLFVKNAGLVGVAVVSGLPDVEDHRLVVSCLKEMMG